MKGYHYYQEYLGNKPEFLKKYLTLDILLRLKDISLLCGMDYASKYAYDFEMYISRFDHSVNVAMITWNLTHDKKATLAALFHDVASPVFSHVIDFMNGDFINQESTEEKTEEILRSSKELKNMLDIDNIDIEDILDFKKYSVVDLDRPRMCADRLDNIIAVGMAWAKKITVKDALMIMDSVTTSIAEDGLEEISFNNREVAEYLKLVNDSINQLTHTKEDNYMMLLVADIIRKCIDLKLVTYDELFKMGEHQIMEIIEKSSDEEINKLWYLFKNIKEFPDINPPEIRNKNLNPLVLGKRLEEK